MSALVPSNVALLPSAKAAWPSPASSLLSLPPIADDYFFPLRYSSSTQERLGLAPYSLGHNRSRLGAGERSGLTRPRLHALNIATLFGIQTHWCRQPSLHRIRRRCWYVCRECGAHVIGRDASPRFAAEGTAQSCLFGCGPRQSVGPRR